MCREVIGPGTGRLQSVSRWPRDHPGRAWWEQTGLGWDCWLRGAEERLVHAAGIAEQRLWGEACLLCAVSSGRSLCPRPRWESSWRRRKGWGQRASRGASGETSEKQVLRWQAWEQSILYYHPGFNSSNWLIFLSPLMLLPDGFAALGKPSFQDFFSGSLHSDSKHGCHVLVPYSLQI